MARPGLLCLLGLAGAFGSGTPAHADLVTALQDFNAGRYEPARAQFQTLAELGDPASQFDLGAMALEGKGGPQDQGTAVGWLMAAADNGYRRLAPEKLEGLKAKLTDEERKVADDILARFGRAGLAQTVLPLPAPGVYCRNRVSPRMHPAPLGGSELYPWRGRRNGQNGFAIIQITVGIDGVPRDPQVLMSVPSSEFSAAAIDAWMPSRWDPAKEDGLPVEARMNVKVVFSLTGGAGVLWNMPALKKIREAAQTGNPTAEYLVGLAASLDPSLGIAPGPAQSMILSAAQGGHPQAQYWVANRFGTVASCGGDRKKMPWLRAAASAGNPAAQLAIAMDLLGGQPSPEQLAEARSLLQKAAASDDLYVMTHVTALLGASPLEALRDPASAITVADRLVKTAPDADPQAFEAAAAAYAAHGNFGPAASREEKAIKTAGQLGWNTAPMLERLALYRKSQPWTGDLFAAAPPPAAAPSSR